MKKLVLFLSLIFTVSHIFSKTGYYRLIISTDPAYGYTLGWIQISGHNPVVYIAPKSDTSNWTKITKIKFIKYKKLKNAFANLYNLNPGTEYFVKIIDSEGSSPLMWFKTIDTGANIKLSVIAGGDSRSRPEVRRQANKMVAKLQPDFVIFDGDFTYSSSQKQWIQWFEDWQLTIYDGRLIPILVVPGNHERKADVPLLFNLTQHPFGYYAISIANNFIYFISLNSQYKVKGKQTHWLEKQLDKHAQDATWTIVAYHKPIRPHYSKKKENQDQYKYWAPLFYKYKVPLVLEGDTHTHKITYPIVPDPNGDEGFSRDDQNGTVYIGEGCWGAPLRPADDIKQWTFDAASIDQFKWLWIDKNSITIYTVEYQSVDSTQQLNYQNKFQIPKGIKLRKYPNNSYKFKINKN